MTNNSQVNAYEEARKQRLEENKRKFEDLGIKSISTSLAELSNSQKKSQGKQRVPKPKQSSPYLVEPRRSTRARNPVKSYLDDVEIGLGTSRKRSRSYPSSWTSYIARPLEEIRSASYEERARAIRAAEEIQENLKAGNPSFVKSMVRSHVYSCFWLGLPSAFCENHLPKSTVDVVLEDEDGTEYDAVYIGKRAGLSGGWRGYALEHKLDDGDAVVFEQVEPTRFKVYIVRASSLSDQDMDVKAAEEKTNNGTRQKANGRGKSQKVTAQESDDLSVDQKLEQDDENKLQDKPSKRGTISKAVQKKTKSANSGEPKEKIIENGANCSLRRSARTKTAS